MLNINSIKNRILYFFFIGLITFASISLLNIIVSGPLKAKSTGYWDVLYVEGAAQWRPAKTDAAWHTLRNNLQLPARVEIRTFGTGHAVVVHGFDKIDLGPGSVINISPEADSDATTIVTQTEGKVGYSVEKRKSGTFSVKTRYLVAVVKGTGFSVDVSDQ